jgi:multiple sugar transport system ATP-binding protein
MILELEHLGKRFGARREIAAVDDVNITVNDGEFLVLLGPSGCGKSTLLNLLAGLESPTSGRISFGGRVVASPEDRIFVPPGERNVAMVFQSYALYPHMTVFENIAFPLRIQGKSRDAGAAVRDVARMLDIEQILERKPGELSGGQRQRVAIGRAIVRRPSVFLLDEPLSNLDAQLRVSTRSELKRLQKSLGVTTLYVTHDQGEATSLGDRVALFREGRLVQLAAPEALYTDPATTFAASFIGTPPINLLEGKLENGKLRVGAVELPGSSDARSQPVQVGIRPEQLKIEEDVRSVDIALNGAVASMELLGREYLYHVRLDRAEILVLHPDRRFAEGSKVSIRFDPLSLLLFDAEGRRIAWKPETQPLSAASQHGDRIRR